MTGNTLHSIEFFDLQLRFAGRVAELCDLSFADAVGRYTNIYVRLGMGPQLDTSNPHWLGYLDELRASREPAALTHSVHRLRLHLPIGPPHAAAFGCFSYAHAGAELVRLHFRVGDGSQKSPLAAAGQRDRREELTALFATLKSSFPADGRIIGSSWLYNLPAYRRLFPKRYLASLRPIAHPYQRMPLWGQFLNRDRSLRLGLTKTFLSSVGKAKSMSEMASCFPCAVLTATSPAHWFYEHFGL